MCLFNYLTATNCLGTKKIIRAVVFIIKLKKQRTRGTFFQLSNKQMEPKSIFTVMQTETQRSPASSMKAVLFELIDP